MRILLITIGLLLPFSLSAQKTVKDSIRFLDKDRSFYLFVPETLKKEAPVPLVVLLHGSGRNGLSLVDKWKDLAAREGFIIVGPDSSDPRSWRIPEDAPDFLYDLIESLKGKHKVDPRRVYLFGHSAGAVVALYLSLMESEYFAATAVHAGSLRADDGPFIERAKRKIPISIFVGTNDAFFPLPVVRETHNALKTRGFDAQLNEIKGHTHNYYGRSDEINKSVWLFLNVHQLSTEPKYERYQFAR